MNKKKIGGILLFLGAVGIIGATSILNEEKSSAVDRDRETARAARKNSIKASSKISELTEQVSVLSSQLSSVNAASLSANSKSTSESAAGEMSASEAEKIALNYYLSLNRKDNGYEPRVDSSKTIEKSDYYVVAVSDTPTHIIEIHVNKKTHQVTSQYLQDTSVSSTSSTSSASSVSSASSASSTKYGRSVPLAGEPGSGTIQVSEMAKKLANEEYADYVYSDTDGTGDGGYLVTFRRKDNPDSTATMEFDKYGNEVNRTGFTE